MCSCPGVLPLFFEVELRTELLDVDGTWKSPCLFVVRPDTAAELFCFADTLAAFGL